MNKRQFHIILFLLLIHTGSNAQNESRAETLHARMNNYLEAGSQNGFSGAIAVVEKGKTIINLSMQMTVLAGEQSGTARGANGVAHVAFIEAHSCSGQPVKVGGGIKGL